MAQNLEVKIVNEKEWSTLVKSSPRYEYVDDDNMGFADPQEGKAYVRQTFWPELNRYLLAHEFEHLLEEEGTDEDKHGVRHKKFFKQVALPILGAIGGSLLGGPIGGALGGGLGTAVGGAAGAGLGGFGGAKLGGASTKSALISGGLSAAGSGLSSAFGGAGKGISQFFRGPTSTTTTSQLGTPGAATTLQSVTPRLATGGLSSGGGLLSDVAQFGGIGGTTGRSPLSLFGNAAGGGGGGGSPFAGQIGPAVSSAAQGGSTGPQSVSNRVLSTLGQFGIGPKMLGPAALGLGVAGIGQLGGPKRPEIPEFGQLPSVQRFGQQSQNQLGSLMSRFQGLPNQALPEALASPIRRNYELQRRQYTSQFKAFRPGADIATDTEYARGINDINQRENEAVAQSQLSFQGEQRQNLLGELGVTEDQMGVLGTLAQADIDTIRLRTGLSAEESAQFKQLFGNLGSAIAGRGIMSQFGVP